MAVFALGSDYLFYVGTYTQQKSKGIYAFRMDPAAGRLTLIGLAAEMDCPSYLLAAQSKSGEKMLYAVSETESFNGSYGSGVAAFSQDSFSGALTPIGTALTNGKDACHLAISPNRSLLFVANYSEGSFTEFTVDKSGALCATGRAILHAGASSHPHYVQFLNDDILCTCDLGTDRISFYQNGDTWREIGFIAAKSGSGPRHIAFDEARQIFYIFCELSGEVIVVKHLGGYKDFAVLQTISSLPPDFTGKNTGAAIRFSADMRFLYVSNRGYDSITGFAAGAGGVLQVLDYTAAGGRTPRDFQLTPDGKWLVAANQDGNSLTVFSVDAQSGKLCFTGEAFVIDSPVCIL